MFEISVVVEVSFHLVYQLVSISLSRSLLVTCQSVSANICQLQQRPYLDLQLFVKILQFLLFLMSGQHFQCDIHLSGLHNSSTTPPLPTEEPRLGEVAVARLIHQSIVNFFTKISCRNQSEVEVCLIRRKWDIFSVRKSPLAVVTNRATSIAVWFSNLLLCH